MKLQHFLLPVRTSRLLLSVENVKEIFSEIEVILNFNLIFLEKLEQRIQQWSLQQTIGDIFVEMVSRFFLMIEFSQKDFFKLYQVYINNYNHAIETLNLQKVKNVEFSAWIQVDFDKICWNYVESGV
jgi:hypothetical protein